MNETIKMYISERIQNASRREVITKEDVRRCSDGLLSDASDTEMISVMRCLANYFGLRISITGDLVVDRR